MKNIHNLIIDHTSIFFKQMFLDFKGIVGHGRRSATASVHVPLLPGAIEVRILLCRVFAIEHRRTWSPSLSSHLPQPPPGYCAGLMATLADGWGPVSRVCSGHPQPASVSREQPACPAPLGRQPIFPLCQTEEEGSREWESSGKLPRGEGGQQRKQKNTSFYPCSLSKALHRPLPLCDSFFPVFSSSHSVLLSPKPLILLLLPLTRSLILNLFFPLCQPFYNCSPYTSLLPSYSLLSIASEHATSQHNPFTHSGWLQHSFSLLHLLNPPCFSPPLMYLSSTHPFVTLLCLCFYYSLLLTLCLI